MITEKGAIVMIVCNLLVQIAASGQIQRICLNTITTVAFIMMSFIIFPIVGIVADTCVRRFKTIQAGIVLLMSSSPQHIAYTPARLSSLSNRNNVGHVYNRIMLDWGQLLCGKCLSVHCRPVDRSIWRTA